ncbi:MAG TPA: hypothetical protein PKA06_13870, partial [Gemmatales bacterium]|nr:hypothetical protein [Gemmatales bacterium]
GYESADAVILATGGNFGNSLVQQLARDTVRREALEQWILQGGHLVVTVASNAAIVGKATDFPLEPLLPMKLDPNTEKEETLSGLIDFIETHIPQNLRKKTENLSAFKAPYARLEPKPNLKPLLASLALDNASFKRPLIVRSPYGLGKVTLVGVDTNSEAFANWSYSQDFWSAVLEARAITLPVNAYYGAPRDDASLSMANKIEEFGDVPVISFALVALFIALYIILIGPVDYFVLKKVFKRLEYTWITFPIVVLLVSLAAYFGAYYLKGDKLRINKVDLIDVDQARERVIGTTWLAIFSPRLQNYQVDLEPQGVTAPTSTLSWLGRYSTYGGARMVGQSSGGLFERDYEYTPTASGIRQLPIQVWSQKSLEARWLGSLERSRAPIENKLVKREGLGIKGSIKLNLPSKLLGVKLFYGEKIWNLGDLESDKTFELDVASQGAAGVSGGNYLERRLERTGSNAQQPDFSSDINGLIFASRQLDGVQRTNEFLRHLNQSWRLKDYSEAILIGILEDDYGEVTKLNQGGKLGTRLKLTNSAGTDLLTGNMRQATYLRVFLPVAE